MLRQRRPDKDGSEELEVFIGETLSGSTRHDIHMCTYKTLGFTIYQTSPGDAAGPHPAPPIFAKEGKCDLLIFVVLSILICYCYQF